MRPFCLVLSFRSAVLALCLLARPISAQVVGASLFGTVTDQSGSAIPGATVLVTNAETGADRKLTTDDAGRWAAPSISVGKYQVRVERQGFAAQVKTGIDLVVGQNATVDFVLRVGEIQQVVTVEEPQPTVSLSTQDTSGVVNETQVKQLPLNGRSYDGLMTLNPGVVNYTSERSGGIGNSNSALGNMFAVSGRRPQENLFLLNGIEYTSASLINLSPGGASGQLLGVEAVREFNIVSNTYGAEYGKRPGGQVSIVTASGSNAVHGSIYEFFRNSDLDARNFFDQGSIPQFQRNDFGLAVGAPIRKDKTFIFGNYEGYRQHVGESDVTLVPDSAARLGYLADANGKLKHIELASGVQPLFGLWPIQNGPDLGGGIAEAFSHPLQTVREDFGTTRVDHTFSDRDSLFAVYTIDDSADDTPTANPLSSVLESLREQVASVQEQHVFSPSLLNTSRFGYSRAGYFFTGETSANLAGWVPGDPIGAVIIGGGTALNGASQITAAGTNAGSSLRAARNLFTYDDHASWMHGRHQIEAGAWFERIQANDNLAQYQYGQASFGSLQNFLRGKISTFSVVSAPTELGWRSLERAGFVQDAIKLTSTLNLRIGFRFESTDGWNEAHGRASNYLFSNGVIQTNPRVGDSALGVNRAKFLPQPRAAIAWDPFGKGQTVIHAGFGIYNALLDDLDYRLDQNAPFNTTQSFKNTTLSQISTPVGIAGLTGGRISPSGIQPDPYTPTVISYSFKIEQTVAPHTSLGVGYNGSRGYHELLSADVNEPFPTLCSAAPCLASLAPGTLYYPTGAKLANPSLANTTTWLTEGVSSYNALNIDVTHHLTSGFQLRAVYTFSKSLDDGTAVNSSVGTNAPGFVMYPGNPKLDWGLSTSDVRHSAAINGLYELPFGQGKQFLNNITGWRGKVATGWSLSGIVTVQSGFPFTPQLGFNPTNNGDTRNPIRPSWNPAFTGSVITGSPNQYFDPNAFVLPVPGTYGNIGRDVLIGPGIAELDASLLKDTAISERFKLQFRAEFFNLLNHANFATPNAVVFSSGSTTPAPTAGVITATSTTSRQIQLGLKLAW